jgi:3-oxoacyl-[acyl-carrier protein] reductase
MRHIIVTGVSKGLGLALCQDLLAQGDYYISACSRSLTPAIEQLQQQYPQQFFWHTCTIGNEAETQLFFETAIEAAGQKPLYGLVNNAGIAMDGIFATFPNIDSERILQTNLLGAMYITRLAVRAMLGQTGGGRIINISSIIGSRGYTGLVPYSISKAGMDGMTRALAREVGRRAITVNSLAPGYIDTDMSSQLGDKQRQQIIGRTPLGRLATTNDIIPVITFLLSDSARFITGQTIIVDGGITC